MREKNVSNMVLSLCVLLLHVVSTECCSQELVYLKHVTQRGETLESMAEMYDVKADMLKTINYGIDTFYTGLEVLIPIDKKYLRMRTEEDGEAILKDLAGYFSCFHEATRLFNSCDYKRASKMYESTIHAYGKYFQCEEAYFALAMCDYNRKKWSSAIDGFTHVIGINGCSGELRDYSRQLMNEAKKQRDAQRERTANFIGGLLQTAAEVSTAYIADSQQNVMGGGMAAMPQGKSLANMNPAQIANITVMQMQQQWAQEEAQFKNNFIASYRRIHGHSPSAEEVQSAYNDYMQTKANAYNTTQRVSSGLYDKELGISSSKSTGNNTTNTHTYGGYKCKKLSATDKAHCNDTGICQVCNGRKVTQDMLGNTIPCNVCYQTGKCPSCHGGK